jgi:hypothetical protein
MRSDGPGFPILPFIYRYFISAALRTMDITFANSDDDDVIILSTYLIYGSMLYCICSVPHLRVSMWYLILSVALSD